MCYFLYVFSFPPSLRPITHEWISTAPSAPSQSLTHVHLETDNLCEVRKPTWLAWFHVLSEILHALLSAPFHLSAHLWRKYQTSSISKEEYYPCVSLQHPVCSGSERTPASFLCGTVLETDLLLNFLGTLYENPEVGSFVNSARPTWNSNHCFPVQICERFGTKSCPSCVNECVLCRRAFSKFLKLHPFHDYMRDEIC